MSIRGWLLIVFTGALLPCAHAQTPLRKWAPLPRPDSLNTGYYVVDSDDPLPNAGMKPSYNFVDTLFQPTTWQRIYPGPLAVPAGKPQVFWNANSTDTIEDVFAGPIPLGFSFNYYTNNFDSVYLSSNGYLGFGTYARATGNDGPGFTAKTPGCFPMQGVPKGTVAFLMTDARMVRTKDSSRAFFRTSPANDSFYLTVYNYFHPQDHRYRADIQIVFAKADSSITFHYRKFYQPTAGVPPTDTWGNAVWRMGCTSGPCAAYAASIGLQNENLAAGTTYMCNSVFLSPGTTELHSGLAVKFRRIPNGARVDQIAVPSRNYEIMLGDSIAPSVYIRNTSGVTRTVPVLLRIRNIATDTIVYAMRDSAVNLDPNVLKRITFPYWRTNPLTTQHIGMMMVEAIVLPPAGTDLWPFDDTVRTTMCVMKRQVLANQHWMDFNNVFTVVSGSGAVMPDASHWMSMGATVVDGEARTFNPLLPRARQTGATGMQIAAPVIVLDRREAGGAEYDRCLLGGQQGTGTSLVPAFAPGDGSAGDTLASFPFDLTGLSQAVVAFSFERAGKNSYPRYYDATALVGPERTVTSPDAATVYRYGDSLVLEFAAQNEIANVLMWKRMWGVDGGKDFQFNRVVVNVPAQYLTDHFRFRFRLKAKNDDEGGTPADDNDEWFVDNIEVINPAKAEIEVSYVGLAHDWPYVRIPATQASMPLEVKITNNGGSPLTSFGVMVTATRLETRTQVYSQLVTIPIMSPGKTNVLSLPRWNLRASGSGTYLIGAQIQPKGYDVESQNDSAFSVFIPGFDSTYVYDDGVNVIPAYSGVPGAGLNFLVSEYFGGTGSASTGTGSVAAKFTVSQTDYLSGVQLWLGSYNSALSPMTIAVFNSAGAIPGTVLVDPCATFTTTRSGPLDAFASYAFPCGPLQLLPGDYWIAISALNNESLALGASDSRASCDWISYDPSANESHVFVANYPEVSDRFAFEQPAKSDTWVPFYFPANIGKPAYAASTARSAYARPSAVCGRGYNVFNGQGSWTPLIRPYMRYVSSILPVELSSLHGRFVDDGITISWTTASERNNAGFFVDRRARGDSAWLQVNAALIPGHGTTGDEHAYGMDDRDIQRGMVYQYSLRQIDNDGAAYRSNIIEITTPPVSYALAQNFPDPFSATTAIVYAIPHADDVTVTITDMLGREIRVIARGPAPGGEYHAAWDGRDARGLDVPAGTYLLTLRTAAQSLTHYIHVVR